ncbi:leucine-rich repeat protein, partial [Skeletonema marinoi]
MDVAIDRQRAMEGRDFDYYEERAQDVVLEDITSCEGNAEILQRLRRQDTSLKNLTISDDADADNYIVGEGDDFGWLGYFIGNSKYLHDLDVYSLGEGQNIEALIDGINRNRLIGSIHIRTDLGDVNFRNLTPFFRNSHRLAQLELNFEVGLECAQSIAFALGTSQCQSLESLRFQDCNLSDEGFAVIANALRTYSQLEELYLEKNNIGLMGCIALGDSMRGWGASNLTILDLDDNAIEDQGLEALAAGMTNTKLEELYLSRNLITGAGLRSMSEYFQSESCCLETLNLYRNVFGDEGAVALADGLMGNKSLTSLRFIPDESGITDVGWAAFSRLLCDPSSINSTYHSNHNIERIGGPEMLSTPLDITQYFELNVRPHPAIHKILKSHPDLEMEPFFQWKLKLLPVVINWFQS